MIPRTLLLCCLAVLFAAGSGGCIILDFSSPRIEHERCDRHGAHESCDRD